MLDIAIKSGLVVLPGGDVRPLTVGIRGDTIASLSDPAAEVDARLVIDADGQWVLPGLIDAHVHTRAPGYEEKETIEACTAAAAAGGITTMLAMFNVDPLVADCESYDHFVEYCRSRSYINYNVNGFLSSDLASVTALIERGVPSLKMLMGYRHDVSGGGGRPDVASSRVPDDNALLEAMKVLAERGVPLVAHAENDDIIRARQQRLQSAGHTTPEAHGLARPRIAEDEAVSRLIAFSRETGCAVHILHLTSGVAVDLISTAQAAGICISAETCPHYLLLAEEDVIRLGSIAKANPPIRTSWDRDKLWEGIANGAITTIGTDHAPHTESEKMVEDPHSDIFTAMAGFSGIETGVPLMLDQVNAGKLTLPKLVDLYSYRPAKYFGIPRRGALYPGSAADVTLVDLDMEWVIDSAKFLSKCHVSPFDGRRVKGAVRTTIVGGRVAFAEGEIVEAQGFGSYVPSCPNTA